MAVDDIAVEVAFALPHKQRIVALKVPSGTTARAAVAMADLPSLFQELPAKTFEQAPLGIFGKALRHPDKERCARAIVWRCIARCRSTRRRPA